MSFIADLHLHSRFSLATSKALTIPYLTGWAIRKGIQVLGTGDFCHPQWFQELKANLVEDQNTGLFRCAQPGKQAQISTERILPEPLFCLQTEISCIYKKNGKTRRVHNLVFMPNMAAAEKFSARLAEKGNIASDGRPILGMDCHDLLEIALESSDEAVLVPAHVWTPWYSLFGAKSGFDNLKECYGDLSAHIFALETGLSSDPPMNRLWSELDRYALISNSDAHSGPNLGREANIFSGDISYDGIFSALRQAAKKIDAATANCKFIGTMEFYPQEGKYYFDGHRKCGISLTPEESRELHNLCPVCGKPLTMGVLHRIMDLADREKAPALDQKETMIVPLPAVVAQCLGIAASSKKVEKRCQDIVQRLGSELAVLTQLPVKEISAFWDMLGEAIYRLRNDKIELISGFDGQYGKVSIFQPYELPQAKI